MRFTRVILFLIALIIGLGFYQLVDYLLQDLESQTFQSTEEAMIDAVHVLAGLLETQSDPEKGFVSLREAFLISLYNARLRGFSPIATTRHEKDPVSDWRLSAKPPSCTTERSPSRTSRKAEQKRSLYCL